MYPNIADIAKALIKVLIDSGILKPGSLAGACRKHSLGLCSTAALSCAEAVFWCTACSHLLSAPERVAQGLPASPETLSAHAADVMCDSAEAMLPESALEWCLAVRRHLDVFPPQWQPAGHLLSVMLHALNFSDAATASAALDLCRDLVSRTLHAPCAAAAAHRAPCTVSAHDLAVHAPVVLHAAPQRPRCLLAALSAQAGFACVPVTRSGEGQQQVLSTIRPVAACCTAVFATTLGVVTTVGLSVCGRCLVVMAAVPRRPGVAPLVISSKWTLVALQAEHRWRQRPLGARADFTREGPPAGRRSGVGEVGARCHGGRRGRHGAVPPAGDTDAVAGCGLAPGCSACGCRGVNAAPRAHLGDVPPGMPLGRWPRTQPGAPVPHGNWSVFCLVYTLFAGGLAVICLGCILACVQSHRFATQVCFLCNDDHDMHAGPVHVAPAAEAESSIDTFATAVSHETSFASVGSRAAVSIASRIATPAASRASPAAATSGVPLPAPPATPPTLHPRPSATTAAPATVMEPADWQAALQQLAFTRQLLVLLPPSCASLSPEARAEMERLLPVCLHLATAAACGGEIGPDQSLRVRPCVGDLAVACVGQYAIAACWHTRWKAGGSDRASLWCVGALLPF